jgi:hypothetical protein
MDTNPNGSVPLDVNTGAAAIMGMLGGEEGEQPTPETQEEYVEQPDTEEQETEQVEETPRYRIKAAGEEVEVTLDDLIKGYQQGRDYTQKTQTLAEQRKAVEAEKAAVEQAKTLRDQYAQRLQMIEQVLSQQDSQEDLNALKESDPIGFAVKVAEQQQRQQQLYAIQAERQRLAIAQQTEQQQRLQQVVTEEQQKLAQAIPEFADPEKGAAVRNEIRSYAKQVGFTDEDLAQVYDSRAVLTLWKAAQYDKLVKGKPEVTKRVTEAPKMLRPGTATGAPPEQKQYQTQRKVLRQTGKARDAAAIFEQFLR